MMKLSIMMVLILQAVCFSYEFDISEESTNCSLSMKLLMDSAATEELTGRATIEVKLCTKEGVPLSGYSLELSSTWGTFLCLRPGLNDGMATDAEERACFKTGEDGLARIRLVNVPVNSPVKVKVVCDCGNYHVFAAGTLSMNKSGKRKK
jgi:hypothetical protein